MARDRKLIERAKAMRIEPTPFEAKLWHALRAKRLNGAKFRQQVVIGRYIVDFACRLPKMLVIEIDGDTHGDQEEYDLRRTAFLESRGYRVLRFTNSDVGTNLHGVLTVIGEALHPSPLQGRGGAAASGGGEGESMAAVNNLTLLPLSPTLSPEGEREQENSLSASGQRVRERGTTAT